MASSKFLAKIATELAKPDGLHIIEPGTEVDRLSSMKVGVIPGVGPVTQEKLHKIGIHLIGELQDYSQHELTQIVGRAQAQGLIELAHARDDRAVEPERETKSISVEDTFATDLVDAAELAAIVRRDAAQVASRLQSAQLFARTVTIKVRLPDFTTFTRSRTLPTAIDDAATVGAVAQSLLGAVDVRAGVRLLGVGVAGLTEIRQDDLFTEFETAEPDGSVETSEAPVEPPTGGRPQFPTPGLTSSTICSVPVGSGAAGSAGSLSGSRRRRRRRARSGRSRPTILRCVRPGPGRPRVPVTEDRRWSRSSGGLRRRSPDRASRCRRRRSRWCRRR